MNDDWQDGPTKLWRLDFDSRISDADRLRVAQEHWRILVAMLSEPSREHIAILKNCEWEYQ